MSGHNLIQTMTARSHDTLAFCLSSSKGGFETKQVSVKMISCPIDTTRCQIPHLQGDCQKVLKIIRWTLISLFTSGHTKTSKSPIRRFGRYIGKKPITILKNYLYSYSPLLRTVPGKFSSWRPKEHLQKKRGK